MRVYTKLTIIILLGMGTLVQARFDTVRFSSTIMVDADLIFEHEHHTQPTEVNGSDINIHPYID